jgi:hypothetical protein
MDLDPLPYLQLVPNLQIAPPHLQIFFHLQLFPHQNNHHQTFHRSYPPPPRYLIHQFLPQNPMTPPHHHPPSLRQDLF